MKILLWISISLLSFSFSLAQELDIKKGELLLEAETKTEEASVQIKSTGIDVKYINNHPEIKSEGKFNIGTLNTENINLKDLINEYSSSEVTFNMIFLTEQFANRSNIELSYKSIMNITINNITIETPVIVIVTNSKSSQNNWYYINITGEISLEDFNLEISFLNKIVNFSYRQTVQVRN